MISIAASTSSQEYLSSSTHRTVSVVEPFLLLILACSCTLQSRAWEFTFKPNKTK